MLTIKNTTATFIDLNALETKVEEKDGQTIKWRDLPIGVVYQIMEVTRVIGKFGKSCILTLKTKEGDSTRLWACSGLNKEKDILEGAYVRSNGFKLSKKSKQ